MVSAQVTKNNINGQVPPAVIFYGKPIYNQTQLYTIVYQQVTTCSEFLSGKQYDCCDGQGLTCPKNQCLIPKEMKTVHTKNNRVCQFVYIQCFRT